MAGLDRRDPRPLRVQRRGGGPDLDQTITLDRLGIPTRITVTGHDYLEAPVDEEFTLGEGRARWQSAAAGEGAGAMTSLRPLMVVVAVTALAGTATQRRSASPPDPLPPLPMPRQLAWQQRELALFLHFGVNTFTDREWGDGRESPAVFDPSAMDARQWARVARETGFRAIILTAKHHDGFALWPSAHTDYSVARSPWRDGRGDVVGELAEAARAEGIGLGLYLSPWDRHEPSYGDEAAYNRFYLAQLRELLTGYGPLVEVWFDGAKGEDARDMAYDFAAYWSLVRELQPDAVIFSDEGPDVRWIGNEHGFAGETNWSMLDRSRVTIGKPGQEAYLNAGDPEGRDWVPGECDVSIRPGWFWHPDEAPKSLEALLEIYFKSVGRNCVLLVNVPPDRRGLLPDEDVARLREFRAALEKIFAVELAGGRTARAGNVRGGDERFGAGRAVDGDLTTYWATDDTVGTSWLEVDLGRAMTFSLARMQEPIALGQRVASYRIEAWTGDAWRTVSRGTTIGYQKLDRFAPVTASRVRLVIERARACPLIAEFGLYAG